MRTLNYILLLPFKALLCMALFWVLPIVAVVAAYEEFCYSLKEWFGSSVNFLKRGSVVSLPFRVVVCLIMIWVVPVLSVIYAAQAFVRDGEVWLDESIEYLKPQWKMM